MHMVFSISPSNRSSVTLTGVWVAVRARIENERDRERYAANRAAERRQARRYYYTHKAAVLERKRRRKAAATGGSENPYGQ